MPCRYDFEGRWICGIIAPYENHLIKPAIPLGCQKLCIAIRLSHQNTVT